MNKDVVIALITFIVFSVAMAAAGVSLGPVVGDMAGSYIAEKQAKPEPSTKPQPDIKTKPADTKPPVTIAAEPAPLETSDAKQPDEPKNQPASENAPDVEPKPPLTLAQADDEMTEDIQIPEPPDEFAGEEPTERLADINEADGLDDNYAEPDTADKDDPMALSETEADELPIDEQEFDDTASDMAEAPIDGSFDDQTPPGGMDESTESEGVETGEILDAQPVTDPVESAEPQDQTLESNPMETGPITAAEPDSESKKDQMTLAKAEKSVSERLKALENGNSMELPDGRIAYKVKSGDTFSQICKKIIGTGSKTAWRQEAERQGIDYRSIYPGKVLYFKGDYGNE